MNGQGYRSQLHSTDRPGICYASACLVSGPGCAAERFNLINLHLYVAIEAQRTIGARASVNVVPVAPNNRLLAAWADGFTALVSLVLRNLSASSAVIQNDIQVFMRDHLSPMNNARHLSAQKHRL